MGDELKRAPLKEWSDQIFKCHAHLKIRSTCHLKCNCSNPTDGYQQYTASRQTVEWNITVIKRVGLLLKVAHIGDYGQDIINAVSKHSEAQDRS